MSTFRELYSFKEGEIADPSSILLSYQIELNASVSRFALTVVEKSRRIGATWGLAVEAVLMSASARDQGGMDTLYLGTSLDMAREFIDACADWSRALMPAAFDLEEFIFKDQAKAGGEDRDILAFRIKFAGGFQIIALSSAARSLRGRQGLVIIDEAAFHDELDEVLKAAIALTIWGGKVVVISTHNGFENPYHQLINEIRSGRRPGNVVRVDLDDAIRAGLYKRICAVTGKDWSLEGQDQWRAELVATYGDDAEEELYCVPKDGSGSALSRALIEQRMTDQSPVIRWEKPASYAELPDHIREADCRDFCERELAPNLARLNPLLRSHLGEDFGRSGDLTVLWPLQVLPDLTRRTPFTVELRNIPFRQQEQILFYILDRLPRFSGAQMDARGNGQALAEFAMQRYGASYIEQVMLSVSWYRENMAQYKAAFEDATITLPRDEDIMSDHRDLIYDKGVIRLPEKGGRRRGSDGKQRHGDSAIAGALAYAASLMDIVPMEFTSTGVNRSDGYTEGQVSEIDRDVGFGAVTRTNHLSGF